MGFADISIRELAEDCQLSVEKIQELCRSLGIAVRDGDTYLALEDVKRILLTVRELPAVESR
ncbi:MAG: translation initiation factor IF-2 [Anaerolineae bacterium]|nr:translation initiation factor IF-2 [Gloeobacterales cyanobacterium ES-bin-313]